MYIFSIPTILLLVTGDIHIFVLFLFFDLFVSLKNLIKIDFDMYFYLNIDKFGYKYQYTVSADELILIVISIKKWIIGILFIIYKSLNCWENQKTVQ